MTDKTTNEQMRQDQLNRDQSSGQAEGTNERLRSEANQAESQAVRQEQAKAEVSGNRDDQRQEKSAIGGGSDSPQTGEPGRARNELDKDQKATSQKSERASSR